MCDNARRDWCFTSWREPKSEYESIKYIVWGKEKCPKSGRIHYQGFACFNRTFRLKGAKRVIGGGDDCHLEPRRGTRREARDYCLKDGEFTEWGRFDALSNAELFKQDIDFLKEEYPEFYCRYHKGLDRLKLRDNKDKWRDVKLVILWSEESQTGKTREAMNHNSVYKLDPPYTWWDGYNGEERIVLDDYRNGGIPRGQLLNICDGYRLRLETKGGHTWASWNEVYITTNFNPECWEITWRRKAEVKNVTRDKAV